MQGKKVIKRVLNRIRYGEIPYFPAAFETPPRKLIETNPTAWKGLELIIKDIIKFSNIKTEKCLEFGVEFGFSTSVFANYFDAVTGVDTFQGDDHTSDKGDSYEIAKNNLKDYPNISLIKSDYRDFIRNNENRFDMIHVDIIHTYEATYDCGLWSAQHSDCTLFHDTISFPDVRRAVADIAKKTNKKFYNYEECNGLGIII